MRSRRRDRRILCEADHMGRLVAVLKSTDSGDKRPARDDGLIVLCAEVLTVSSALTGNLPQPSPDTDVRPITSRAAAIQANLRFASVHFVCMSVLRCERSRQAESQWRRLEARR
jgi:hypothetical protein